MPITKKMIDEMSPEERQQFITEAEQEIKGRQGGTTGGRILRGVGRGIVGGLRALPHALRDEVPPTPEEPKKYAPTTREEALEFEREKKGIEEEPTVRKVGLVDPVTGEIKETETDADVILKGIVEKPEAELKSTDLINITRILAMEPTGEITGGRFGPGERGLGSIREFTPEQQILRQRARELLDRTAGKVEIAGEFSKEEEDLIKENMRAHKKTRAEVISALRERELLP